MRVRGVWRLAALLSALCLSACAAESEEGRGRTTDEASATQETPAGGPSSRGAEAAEVDAGLAAQGEALMQAKGCTACHTVGGGRLVGPDLAGVAERRSPEFIIGMIVNPDSMLANDATAKELLGQYFTPMANQGVTEADAWALLEFFKWNDAEADGSDN
ncbi:MAG: cytochrome c [Gemmatimonadota bacterium]|nr:MAG: cytochrome c [Gemmatimonadota bacterium]